MTAAALSPAGMRVLASFLLLLSLVAPGNLQAQDSTSQSPTTPLFTTTDGYFAASAALATFALSPLDAHVAGHFGDSAAVRSPAYTRIVDGVALVGGPGTLVIAGGMYAVGRIGDRDVLASAGLRTAEAVVLAQLITYGVKGLAGRARPRVDGSTANDFRFGRGVLSGDYRSFPSGHTSAAFAAATVLVLHPDGEHGVQPLAAALLYTAATLTATSRIYRHEHWVSDTVLGAAVGLYSGWKVTRYHEDHPDSRLDRWLLSVSFIGGGPPALRLLPIPGS